MITYHHIGGRNGTYPLPLKTGPLLNEFHLVLYDADKDCFEQMKGQDHTAWGKVSVYPYGIGGKTGTQPFHLTFHPTNNSLYRFNEAYKEYTFVNNPIYGEYVFGDAFKPMKSIDLDLLSLGDALARSNIPGIDFLSLDVQGAEYDILEGSQVLLSKNCIGIQLEVEFVQLYQDQKTFSDINVLMERMGFELLELGTFGRCAPMSLPIGFRGLEQPLYAEAVYIKKASELVKEGDVEGLYKGALFSLIYKKLGLCIKFLSKIDEISAIGDASEQDSLYKQSLAEIWALHNASKHLKLPQLSQLFSNERFQNYYALKEQASMPHVEDFELRQAMQNALPLVKEMYRVASSPLENVLKQYGFDELADVTRQTRMHEAECFSALVSTHAEVI